MKYVSIDIETTGLNPKKCQVLEFAAIVDDLKVQAPLDQLPKFHAYIRHPIYTGEAFALQMNYKIFRKLASLEGEKDIVNPEELFGTFHNFLVNEADYPKNQQPEINVAGKNFAAFDKNFLDSLPNNNWIKFHHRVLDPAILFFDPNTDEHLPNLKTCLERASIKEEVSHNALDDAMQVVKLIRFKYPKK